MRKNKRYDFFVLRLLLATPTNWSSLDHRRLSHKRNQKEMVTFCFFSDSAYGSDFFFFHLVASALTTPLTTPAPNPLLGKTGLKC